MIPLSFEVFLLDKNHLLSTNSQRIDQRNWFGGADAPPNGTTKSYNYSILTKKGNLNSQELRLCLQRSL